MRNHIQKFLMIVAFVFGGLLLIFILNQTVQLIAAAGRVSPLFGSVVRWAFIALYVFAVVVLLWNFFRLPKPLRAPHSEDSPQFETFLKRLRNRLRSNPELSGRPLDSREDIDAALTVLGERADDMTRDAALQAFFVTAISQNGNLDALAVLAIHGRLVYDVARLYYQRPTVRDLLYLYGNVVVAAVVARQLDDWDMTEYVTPIINATMGSAIGAVPGASAAANAAVHAVLTGSANAYMTLRVGVIAKRYCSSVTQPDRKELRDGAFVEAVKMFPGIVGDGTKKVFQIVGNAAFQGTKTAVDAVGTGVKQAAGTVVETVRRWADARGGGKLTADGDGSGEAAAAADLRDEAAGDLRDEAAGDLRDEAAGDLRDEAAAAIEGSSP